MGVRPIDEPTRKKKSDNLSCSSLSGKPFESAWTPQKKQLIFEHKVRLLHHHNLPSFPLPQPSTTEWLGTLKNTAALHARLFNHVNFSFLLYVLRCNGNRGLSVTVDY